jgi:pimeloyl-ACP methyl ester carboxylesterase
VHVEENTTQLGGSPVLYRSAPRDGTPLLYLHGVPTSSADWLPFLERAGGLAPDLIGFGRSGKGGHLDYTIDGLATFVEALLEQLQIDTLTLVGHDWGAVVGLVLAQRHPDRIQRLALINAPPLFDAARFPIGGLARLWRRPLIGELVMGATNRWLLARELRKGGPWSDEQLDTVWEDFDQGTQRAILRLYRSADPNTLGAIGGRLGTLVMPALVVWGEQDPWLPPELGSAYAARLPRATLISLAKAGHWPWLDDHDAVDRVTAFLDP